MNPLLSSWSLPGLLLGLLGAPLHAGTNAVAPPAGGEAMVHRLAYEGRLGTNEARFVATLDLESTARHAARLPLFDGDLVIVNSEMPAALRLARDGREYQLLIPRPGRYRARLEFVVRLERSELWNQARFTGPPAGLSTVAVQATEPGVEVELLSGLPLETAGGKSDRICGALGGERQVAVRWRGQSTEPARKAMVTCESTVTVHATPSALQLVTELRYEILQGSVTSLQVAVPTEHTLTRVEGDQIRDWQVTPGQGTSLLRVDLIRPVEGPYALRVSSEQPVDHLPLAVSLEVPAPSEADRVSGEIVVQAEDLRLDPSAPAGGRRVNAPAGAQAAFRFHGRPGALGLLLERLEPVVRVADRLQVRLEDTRLLAEHALDLTIEKAGLYAVTLGPLQGWTVADVRGEGVEDWQVRDDQVHLTLARRWIGQRPLAVHLERGQPTFPADLEIRPLRVSGAERQTAQIGVVAAAGLQLKTAALEGLREVPAGRPGPGGAGQLAYVAGDSDWALRLRADRLASRVIADIFNLLTIGDGVVGGSATVRYAILNQGVQEFRLRLPARWRNVDFTGPNIRRKDRDGETWTITLQDKVWGGYTLVVTYDEPFDPHQAVLTLGGIHAEAVERETGSLAVTSAGSFELQEDRVAGPLRRIDEAELAEADRALITRSARLAYRYHPGAEPYELRVKASRFEASTLLAAVSDRTQMTTVLTDDGQLLTQATFLVKNQDKQFQSFDLPRGARLWSSFVNGTPVKVEQLGATLLVPLPRAADRDQLFAVELVYAEQLETLETWKPRRLALAAPVTDVQTTYAEWELYVPTGAVPQGFLGSMQPVRGTTYGWQDGWAEFQGFYAEHLQRAAGVAAVVAALAAFTALVTAALRRGFQGFVGTLAILVIVAILAGMMLPALAKAKGKAQRIAAVNSLKQIGLAVRVYATDNGGVLPASFEEMRRELGTEKITIDPQTGRRFVYVGGALPKDTPPDALLAYSPESDGARAVVLADGSVQQMAEARFQEALRQTAALAGVGVPAVAPNAEPQEAQAPALSARAVPFAAALQPLRVEVPRTGQRLVFTKVLSVRREPLSVQFRVVRASVWRTAQSLLQGAMFLTGLAVARRELRRARPRSGLVAAGAALVLGSVGALLVTHRLLGAALIIAAPLSGAVVAVILYRCWRARARIPADQASRETAAGAAGMATFPPVLVSLGIVALSLLAGKAADSTGAKAMADPAAPEVLSARYTGCLRDKVGDVTAEFRIRVEDAPTRVALLGNDLAVHGFESGSSAVQLARDSGGVGVTVSRRGEFLVRLRGLVRTGGDVTRRSLGFQVPTALASHVDFSLAEAGATVDFPGAVSVRTRPEADGTRVEAVLGAVARVDLCWTPRVKRDADVVATAFCRSASRVTFGGGLASVRTVLDYELTQGELRELRVRLPQGYRLLRAEGEAVRRWQMGDAGELRVELLRGMAPACRLTLETERSLEALPGTFDVEVPHALGVQRETGWVAVAGGEETGVSVESLESLQQGDGAEFLQTPVGGAPVAGAYRFLRPEFRLRVRIETLQPVLEATARHLLSLEPDELRLESTFDFLVQRAGVFALSLQLPADYHLESVGLAGTNLAPSPLPWTGRMESGQRWVDVALGQRTLGRVPLVLRLVRPLRELPPVLEVVAPQPGGVRKLTGHLLVSATAGVQVKTRRFDGLAEVPAGSVPGSGQGLAFKFGGSPGSEPVPWTLSLTTERLDAWVRAEVVNWLSLGDSLVNGRAVVRYEIQNAPARELNLRLPASFRNVEITGPDLRRIDRTNDVWRIELQHRVTGSVTLQVTWDQPFALGAAGEDRLFQAAGVEVPGVERETGLLVIGTPARLELRPAAPRADWVRVDTLEIPEWAGRPDASTLLAWRYLRPGQTLGITARRFDAAAVLQGLIEEARLTTVIADDGQMMTQMKLSVRNNGRQFLEVTLPAGAELWSAFVGGQPLRPGRRDRAFLLPLDRPAAGASVLPVELTYVGGGAFPARRGRVGLDAPGVNLPVRNARWEFYLPADFDYRGFGGTMTFEAGAERLVGDFSLDEYSQVESVRRRDREIQVSNSILDVKSKLASGQLEFANRAFNTARRQGDGDRAELKALEVELNKAQTRNLKAAQQQLVVQNYDATQRLQTTASAYDDEVAGQQWARLQQAQDVATAAVRPLRVNLPTRGLRHAFSQAIQTQPGKPLHVEFTASHLRTSTWPLRLGTFAATFLALWGLTAFALRRRAPQPPVAA